MANILFRPNNYRRQVRVRQRNKEIIEFINSTFSSAHFTGKLLFVKDYFGITLQYGKNFLTGIYSQQKIGGFKETYWIEADNQQLLAKRIDQIKEDIKDKIDYALLMFIKRCKLEIPGQVPKWSRYEDWLKGEEFIDQIPREVIIHDTVFKKVYPSGIEFKKYKGESPGTHIKNYIKTRALEDVSPEIVESLRLMGEKIKKLSVVSVDEKSGKKRGFMAEYSEAFEVAVEKAVSEFPPTDILELLKENVKCIDDVMDYPIFISRLSESEKRDFELWLFEQFSIKF